MQNHYIDSSLISSFLLQKIGFEISEATFETLYTSRLTEVEVHRTLIRAKSEKTINENEFAERCLILNQIIKYMNVIEINSNIVFLAKSAIPFPLKTLDSIHLASAIHLKNISNDVQFHTLDKRQANAAKVLGMETKQALRE